MPPFMIENHRTFITPEQFGEEQFKRIGSPRGQLLVASCRSGADLANDIYDTYCRLSQQAGSTCGLLYLPAIDFQFSDSETCVRLNEHIGGYDVFLVQSLYNPVNGSTVDHNYFAFLIAARTFKEHGANHITGVLPYLAYGRQDKPSKFMREPTTAKLMADLSIEAGIDRLVTWHSHIDQIRGFYGNTPVTMLDTITLFLEVFQRFAGRDDVIAVAPDVGASKFITYFSRGLDIKSAIASKHRPRPEVAAISEIIGDFRGKRVAIVLDDMISSGGTIYQVVQKLVTEKNIEEVYVGAAHNLCSAKALERMQELHEDYHLRELVVTDSVPQTEAFRRLPFITIRSIAETLSRTINRVHYNKSVSELFMQSELVS